MKLLREPVAVFGIYGVLLPRSAERGLTTALCVGRLRGMLAVSRNTCSFVRVMLRCSAVPCANALTGRKIK